MFDIELAMKKGSLGSFFWLEDEPGTGVRRKLPSGRATVSFLTLDASLKTRM